MLAHNYTLNITLLLCRIITLYPERRLLVSQAMTTTPTDSSLFTLADATIQWRDDYEIESVIIAYPTDPKAYLFSLPTDFDYDPRVFFYFTCQEELRGFIDNAKHSIDNLWAWRLLDTNANL
jgi:hypothetical protein